MYLSLDRAAPWTLWRLLDGTLTVWVRPRATLRVAGARRLQPSGMRRFNWTTEKHKHPNQRRVIFTHRPFLVCGLSHTMKSFAGWGLGGAGMNLQVMCHTFPEWRLNGTKDRSTQGTPSNPAAAWAVRFEIVTSRNAVVYSTQIEASNHNNGCFKRPFHSGEN